MILPKELPREFRQWNATYGAPGGAPWWNRLMQTRLRKYLWQRRMRLPGKLLQAIGPFGFQANNTTREGEYPWCFFATPLEAGMTVVEIGAGASGFQFVMSRMGLTVKSVDPLVNPDESIDWIFSEADYERLNRVLGCDVEFIRKYLMDTRLPQASVDRVFAISVIEHIPPLEIHRLMKEVHRILKNGGYFIATIDLFLDLEPFTSKRSNAWGSNIPVRSLVEQSGLSLAVGNTRELLGYPDFDPAPVLRTPPRFMVCHSVASQCIVLQKTFNGNPTPVSAEYLHATV
jgi:SAM-dependent methyltransferase